MFNSLYFVNCASLSLKMMNILSLLFCVHIQIPPTGYVGLILHSTAVATVSWSIIEGTLMLL